MANSEQLDHVPSRATRPNPSIYASSVESTAIRRVINLAVDCACAELDTLFPDGAEPSPKITEAFKHQLGEHIAAMLTGLPGYQSPLSVKLPPLLAGECVFGVPFSLPDVSGAGYMVFRPGMGQLLCASTAKFVRAEIREQPNDSSAYQGMRLWVVPGVQTLFPTFDIATRAALDNLLANGLSPQDSPLHIVGGVFDPGQQSYRVL